MPFHVVQGTLYRLPHDYWKIVIVINGFSLNGVVGHGLDGSSTVDSAPIVVFHMNQGCED